ncbi:MAG TPA: protein kinase [Polyangiaceae bacterium]
MVPSWAALDTSAGSPPRLVVVERVTRGSEYGDQEIADWVRDARCIATLEHPNVGRIRDVVIAGEEVCVVSDYVDGVRWLDLVAAEPRPPLEAALRVLVDVLTGLSAIHNLRDAKRQPLKLVHGELTPECIVVGTDGVARIVSGARLHSATARPGASGSAYLAPEILLADESADARADVYSVGVVLWELLSGRALFPTMQPSAIVTHLLSGRVPLATIPEGHAWAAPFAGLTARALSADPAKRFASAAAMAAEIRRIAGPKLAPPTRMVAHVRAVFGDAVRSRREKLERGEGAAQALAKQAEPVEEDVPISLVPTPVPPPPTATTKPPPPVVPPPLPKIGQPAPPKIALPTPLVAITIPQAARVPDDLEPGLGEIPAPAQAATRSQSPAPAVPPVVTPVDAPAPAPTKRSRATALALVATPVVLLAAAVVWWLALRSPESTQATVPTARPAPAAPPASAQVSPVPAAPTESAPLQAVSSAQPQPPPSASAAPAATGPDQPPAQVTGYSNPNPAPVVRPPPRPKYEPEGI